MDFTKIDFTKFDVTKMLDVTSALDQIESSTRTALTYVPDAKSREITQTLIDATIDLARAQNAAVLSYLDTVKRIATVK